MADTDYADDLLTDDDPLIPKVDYEIKGNIFSYNEIYAIAFTTSSYESTVSTPGIKFSYLMYWKSD